MSQSWTFEAWFNQLPSVDIESLDKDDKNCGICRVEYSSSSSASDQQEDPIETPVRLPCGHVFGTQCLKEWLNPDAAHVNNKTCPTCRHHLGEYDPVFTENLRHLQWLERLDYANDTDRSMVLGGLVHTLNEQDARREFLERVNQEQRNQQQILESRRDLLVFQRRAAELGLRLEELARANEQMEERVEQQEMGLRRANEQLRQHVERQQVEFIRIANNMDGIVREAGLRRHEAFFRQGRLTQAMEDEQPLGVDTPNQEHREHREN